MFLTSGSDYYSYPLLGLTVVTKTDKRLSDVTVKFKLLSYSDLYKLDLMKSSGFSLEDMYEEVCNKCIIGLLHYDEDIDLANSPAGIATHIGSKILHHSKALIDDVQKTFENLVSTVTVIDQMSVIVSKYTITPLKEVKAYPIDRLVKEYATIHLCFPDTIKPIVLEEEKESKVGG